MCLSQLRSSAKGHLKIPTAKPTQHISSHGERDRSAKAFVPNCLWIFHSLCDTLDICRLPAGSRLLPAWGQTLPSRLESLHWVYCDFPLFCIFILKTSQSFLFFFFFFSLFLMKILVRRNCISGLMYFCHSFSIMLMVMKVVQ